MKKEFKAEVTELAYFGKALLIGILFTVPLWLAAIFESWKAAMYWILVVITLKVTYKIEGYLRRKRAEEIIRITFGGK